MVKAALRRKMRVGFGAMMAAAALSGLAFTVADDFQLLSWTSRSLQSWYNTAANAKLKAWNLTVTPDYFLRLRRNYQNGKQEYYSFHLHRFRDMDYLGSTSAGTLHLFTNADDIIVQTYHDPAGDVDSMATCLDLPVHDVKPEQLDSLRDILMQLKDRH